MCFILKCEREICAFKVTDFFLLLHFTTNPCDRKGKKWNYILSAQEARIDRTAARWTPGPPPPSSFSSLCPWHTDSPCHLSPPTRPLAVLPLSLSQQLVHSQLPLLFPFSPNRWWLQEGWVRQADISPPRNRLPVSLDASCLTAIRNASTLVQSCVSVNTSLLVVCPGNLSAALSSCL